MNFWIFKFNRKYWNEWNKQEVGNIFETSVKNYKQMSNSIGDIVLWYEKGKIYLVTEVISDVEQDLEYFNYHKIKMRVLSFLGKEGVSLKNLGFEKLFIFLQKTKRGTINYKIENNFKPEELYKKLQIKKNNFITNIQVNENLLKKIKKIKSEIINEGFMFNPFLDSNLIKNEIKHISFLANLLNPYGTHMQGDIFLKEFLREIKINNFETYNTRVTVEEFIPKININCTTKEKGRIDLWIENKNKIIAIEAKVDSFARNNQLQKYNQYLECYSKEKNKEFELLYLTIRDEKIDDNLRIIHIKYQIEILNWLKRILNYKLPDRLKSILIDYQNSLKCYIYKVSPKWKYELKLLETITQNEFSYQEYKNLKDIYFYKPQKYKFTEAEDIAEIFPKIKAYIEYKFFREILNNLELKDNISNIFAEDNLLNDEIIIMSNINSIYEIQKNRFAYNRNEKKDFETFIGIEIIKNQKFYIVWGDTIYIEYWNENDEKTILYEKSSINHEKLLNKQKLEKLVYDISNKFKEIIKDKK